MAIVSLFLAPFNIKKHISLLISHGEHLPLEFSSLFLFFSELCALLFIFLVVFYKRKELFSLLREGWFFILFGLVGIISACVSDVGLFSFVFAIHLCVAIFFLCCIATVVRDNVVSVRDIIKVFAVNALIQSEVALLQFFHQSSLGLKILGEEVINEFTRGVAKIDTLGAIFYRSYGTVSHPNILGGILFVGLLAWIYLFVAPTKKQNTLFRAVTLIGLFITLAGLVVSFSRSAWIVSIIFCFICILVLFFKKNFKHAARELIIFTLVTSSMLLGIFGGVLVTRSAINSRDTAIQERVVYVTIAQKLISEYPFGVGIGNGITRAEREGLYDALGLTNTSTHQPVHNIYLLITEELGFLGGFIFVLAVFRIFFDRRKHLFTLDYLFPCLMALGLLCIGLVDHYMITSNVGRLLFFGILGIIMGLPRENDGKNGRHL